MPHESTINAHVRTCRFINIHYHVVRYNIFHYLTISSSWIIRLYLVIQILLMGNNFVSQVDTDDVLNNGY
jgi:hypothetical protein